MMPGRRVHRPTQPRFLERAHKRYHVAVSTRTMCSSASSRVRVGTALSPAFLVQRGVAQGCALSPLMYAIFIQDMQSLSLPDMLWVGPATSKQKLVGQAYADDLAGTAATQQGLQRLWMRSTPIACAGVGFPTFQSRW